MRGPRAQPPPNFIFKFLPSHECITIYNGGNAKSIISQKQRIAKKKSTIQKLRSEHCTSFIFSVFFNTKITVYIAKYIKYITYQKLRIAQKKIRDTNTPIRTLHIFWDIHNFLTFLGGIKLENYVQNHLLQSLCT